MTEKGRSGSALLFKTMISILIPFRNDFTEIHSVVEHITRTASSDDFEIVIYNDGSFDDEMKPRSLVINNPKVRVINSDKSFGVGHSFDRAFEQCTGDIIILQGSDVYPMNDWYVQVVDAVKSHPNTLGCSVCVGISPDNTDFYDPKNIKRFGADLLFYVDNDDLPKTSNLRKREGGYTSLFKAKWLFGKQSDEPYEIPCVLGAFYFCSREYFKTLGGWDTVRGDNYRGHRAWGHLEGYISLKSWLVGGGCMMFPQIESAHMFDRVTEERKKARRRPKVRRKRLAKGGRSEVWMHWNKLFILETMIFDEILKRKLYGFMHPEKNWGEARKLIKEHWGAVQEVRERNLQRFKSDHTIFAEKFGYSFEI